jgi:hypothetical protein
MDDSTDNTWLGLQLVREVSISKNASHEDLQVYEYMIFIIHLPHTVSSIYYF